jgi:riboflavin kinase/FMN adenylyltransferase
MGADFAFGHNREGNIDFLIRHGQESGFDVHVVARRKLAGQAVSSTAVRTLLAQGDVAEAARLLGHYFGFEGSVVAGFGRGVGLGYPTANIQAAPAQQLPATGIYAGYLRLNDRRYPAAISVGYNPVFAGTELRVEAYVLDFEGNLRDRTVGVEFVQRLRDEQNFEGVDQLIAQMGRDVAQAREILQAAKDPNGSVLHP